MSIQQKKVLHVSGGMDIGGTETLLMNIYRNIDRNKVNFDFVSYSIDDLYYDEEIKQLGGKIFNLKNKYSILELVKVIKNNGPYEVIHAHTHFHCGIVMIAAILCNVKIRISHAHTNMKNDKILAKKIYIKLMTKLINMLSSNLLACSKDAGEILFGSINSHKYTFFPNGINFEKFLYCHKNTPKEEINKDKIIVGHIGRFAEEKNHEFILYVISEMLKKKIDVELILVGDGILIEKIKKLSINYNISERVHFLGKRNDISNILQKFDVFLFPSKCEGFGLVLLEAQACGIPCIVSKAIQPEVDIGLNLINYLSLENPVDLWINKIVSCSKEKKVDNNLIIKSFENSIYSIKNSIKLISSIYDI